MVTALSSLIVSHNVLTHANELAGFSVVTMKQYLLLRLLSLTEVDIKWMGKHREECRKNYFKKWQKMLKERKAQGENPTSHLQEEKRSSSPRESIVKNLIARKKEAMKVMKIFGLMQNITLLVTYLPSCNLTQFANCEEEGKQQ